MRDLETSNLMNYGLNTYEADVYVALLEAGSSTVLELSKKTGINRITVHNSVESLRFKGLASTFVNGKRRKIIAEPPEKLKEIIRQEKKEIERKELVLEDIVNGLYKRVNNIKDNTDSEVKYIEGFKAVRDLYDEILRSKQVKTILNSVEITRYFPENTNKFIDAVKRGVDIWDLHQYGSLQDVFATLSDTYLNYHAKSLPADLKDVGAMDYLLYEGKIVLIQGDKIPKAVVIKNDVFYYHAEQMYKLLWRLL